MANDSGQPRTSDSSKVIFANQLRALAVVSVLISHLCGMYYFAPEYIARTVHSPLFAHKMPEGIAWLFSDKHNFGPLGVAVFFLISGFVIPFSFERYSKAQFAIARLLRIYPTYLCALFIEVAVLAVSSLAWDQRVRVHLVDIVDNILLIQGFTGVKSIDQVNWSLSIELKFYLAAVLMSTWIKAGRLWPLFVLPIAGLMLNLYLANQPESNMAMQLSLESMYLGYMFIGTLFHYRFKKQVSILTFWIVMTVIMALTLISWKYGYFSAQFFYPVTANYVYALIIFGFAYVFRDRFRPIPIVDWIANISYPLYLIHAIVGYSLLQYLMGRHEWSYGPAILVTGLVVLGIAQMLHQTVEIKSHAWGRRLAGQTHLNLPRQASNNA